MYTRWRLYILAVFVALIAGILLTIHFLRRHGVRISTLQSALLVAGAVLTVESIIISTLSNFNLGVILPAFFGVPLMALAVFLPHMQHGFPALVKWVLVGCYALAGVIFLVCGSLMLSARHSQKNVSADAVVVLGAAVHGDKVTWVLENRLNTAIAFLAANPTAVAVVSGGQGAEETVTEASAMKKYMVARGVPESRVLLEEHATNTPENFTLSKPIIDASVGKNARIAFVTTDFHVYRASRVAQNLGIPAVGISAPDVWYLRLNNFLRECVGICVYALRGQL